MSNFINYTTKYSQINGIRQEIIGLRKEINGLTGNMKKLNESLMKLKKNSETSSDGVLMKHKGLIEITGDLITSGNIVSENINNLSANVDIMLGQMLEAQRQLMEANTITVEREMNEEDVKFEMKGDEAVIGFNRKPCGLDDEIVLMDGEGKVSVFFDYKHNSTHAGDPNYKPRFEIKNDGDEKVIKMKMKSENVRLVSHKVKTNYEFDQDKIISYLINYFDTTENNFFKNMLVHVNEIKN